MNLLNRKIKLIRFIGNDDASRNQWCSRLSCSRSELEAAIAKVGPDGRNVKAWVRRRRFLGAAADRLLLWLGLQPVTRA